MIQSFQAGSSCIQGNHSGLPEPKVKKTEEPCWLWHKEAVYYPPPLERLLCARDVAWPAWKHTCAPAHVCHLPSHCPHPWSAHGDDGHNQKQTFSDLRWRLGLRMQATAGTALVSFESQWKRLWSALSSCFLRVTKPKALACVQYRVRT